jgi:iron only hydrogenase large subunit-like protein
MKKEKIAMLAPSFIAEFDKDIVSKLRKLGFDKVVELTFGAKMINRDYHKILEKSKELVISSVCPGIVSFVKEKFPQFEKNLIKVDSPMAAMVKICRKNYPGCEITFISPCNFKKQEGKEIGIACLDYRELSKFFQKKRITVGKNNEFDKFYNEYTRIYPLSGGLSKTAHLKGVLKKGEEKTIDGWKDVEAYLKKPNKEIRFLDCTFCKGGCVGGPYLSRFSLGERKKRVLAYLEQAKKESIKTGKRGLVEKALGISFRKEF